MIRRTKKLLVIIESPFKGNRAVNVKYAQRCMLDSLKRGEAPFLSHLLYTQCLEDDKPEDRKLGMEAGREWIRASDKTAVYTDYGVSDSMLRGIDLAEILDHKIEYRTIGKNK